VLRNSYATQFHHSDFGQIHDTIGGKENHENQERIPSLPPFAVWKANFSAFSNDFRSSLLPGLDIAIISLTSPVTYTTVEYSPPTAMQAIIIFV